MKPAKFVYDSMNEYFIPGDKNAVAVTAVISNRYPRMMDMILIRKHGYIPLLMNGQEIRIVDMLV